MDNKYTNKILITIGLIVTIVLFVAAGFAYCGMKFANSQVNTQLIQEQIYFPEKGASLDPKTFPGLQQYAGQQVNNGVKAKAYANEFIWVHMMKSSGGKTYAEVSTAAKAAPTDANLAALKNTLFQGDMLRSSLLTAYAFSVFGMIAQWATIVCIIGGFLVFIVTLICYDRINRANPNSKKVKTVKKKK